MRIANVDGRLSEHVAMSFGTSMLVVITRLAVVGVGWCIHLSPLINWDRNLQQYQALLHLLQPGARSNDPGYLQFSLIIDSNSATKISDQVP